MKLREWACLQEVSYKTAWRWVKQGKMPVPYEHTATATIILKAAKETSGQVALYARVSDSDRKSDLDRQIARMIHYANSQGWSVGKTVTETGSSLDKHRPELMKLLFDPKIQISVVEHKDRLIRFCYEYVESALAVQGCRMVEVDPGDVKDDLAQDIVGVFTSFCARLYSR